MAVGQSLLWQADAHLYFRVASGYFGHGPAAYQSDLAVAQLQAHVPATNALVNHDAGAFVIPVGVTTGWTPIIRQAGFTNSVTVAGVSVLCP